MLFAASSSIDWKTVRDTINLADVVAHLLGPAPGRRGERGRRLWWRCPFHEDRNPSLCVYPGKAWWRCYGCGAKGDAVALVRRLNPAMTFPEVVVFLTGGPAPSGKPMPRSRPPCSGTANEQRGTTPKRPPADAPTGLSGMPEADATALVEASAARLWTPEGADALAYLRGRGLDNETILAARLGCTADASVPTREGDRCYRVAGVVVPWFSGDRLALAKVRQPEGRKPKYAEVFRDPARLACYPGPEVIRPGRPLIITEGEFDALLLGQELAPFDVAVLTLGSASARPGPAVLGRLLAAAPWFVATDRDEAGDKAAVGWPACALRIRPPGTFKDWTEVRQGGVDLRRWWGDILAGCAVPPLFTWDELAALRWGPAKDDPTPGIVIDRPDRGRMLAALQSAADDPEERAAIQGEDVCGLDSLLCDNEGDGERAGCRRPAPLIRPLS
jgi:hypothetical protein